VFQSSLATEPLLILTALIAVYIVLGMLYREVSSSTHDSFNATISRSWGAIGPCLSPVMSFHRFHHRIILLIGIVKKNAIMMVDFALEAERHEGLAPEEKRFYRACLIRFRPS